MKLINVMAGCKHDRISQIDSFYGGKEAYNL